MSPNNIATRTITHKMMPQTFVERLPPANRAHLANYIANQRVPKKTFEELPLTEEEMAAMMSAFMCGHSSEEEALGNLHQFAAGQLSHQGRVLGDLCPPEGTACHSIEFDHLKVFYHHEVPSYYPQGTYSLYVGRRGCLPNECIDWWHEGIRITALGVDYDEAPCRMIQVIPGGSKVRFHYVTETGVRKTTAIVLPILSEEDSRLLYQRRGNLNDEAVIDLGSGISVFYV